MKEIKTRVIWSEAAFPDGDVLRPAGDTPPATDVRPGEESLFRIDALEIDESMSVARPVSADTANLNGASTGKVVSIPCGSGDHADVLEEIHLQIEMVNAIPIARLVPLTLKWERLVAGYHAENRADAAQIRQAVLDIALERIRFDHLALTTHLSVAELHEVALLWEQQLEECRRGGIAGLTAILVHVLTEAHPRLKDHRVDIALGSSRRNVRDKVSHVVLS